MIKMNEVTHSFSNPELGNDILKCINLEIKPGEIFGIIGRSGAGKSTLVRTLNGLTHPNQGNVYIDGQCLQNVSKKELRLIRRKIGMIFQSFNLLESRNVFDNIALPLELAGLSRNLVRKKISPIIDLVGLSDYRYRYPWQLSGGQKQRVGIARALAGEPKILLSDEATSALDAESTRSILDLIKYINVELNVTIVLITHQMEVIKQISERVAVIDAGRIVEIGSVIDIFLHPHHEITRGLIGHMSTNILPLTLKQRIRETFVLGLDHLFRFTYASNSVGEPIIAELSRKYSLNFSILYGQVEEIQGQAFGSLIVLLRGNGPELEEGIIFMRSYGVIVEELSHSLED